MKKLILLLMCICLVGCKAENSDSASVETTTAVTTSIVEETTIASEATTIATTTPETTAVTTTTMTETTTVPETTKDMLKEVYASDKVLTLDELPDLKNYK